MNTDKVLHILEKLRHYYPDARSGLNFTNPFELLIATMLSAQSTDRQVNRITERLFRDHASPQSIASLTTEELESYIRGCGLFHAKSRNILATCRLLLERHDGGVPDDQESLLALPGVGRKTANVVLTNAFGQPAMAVDTHVFRVANRLGLARSDSVKGTERDLCDCLPPELWRDTHHWLIAHGRQVCHARNPLCSDCFLREDCSYSQVI